MNIEQLPYEIETRVAIIGVALRVPGADSADQFWKLLLSGENAIRRFDKNTLLQLGIDKEIIHDPNYVPVHGIIPDIGRFDAQHFGYSPREAEWMDPQQRILLELAWHSLESAGVDPGRTDYRIGVFAGIGSNQYAQKMIYASPERIKAVHGHSLMLGNEKDFAATRIAYKLNLNGPAINIQSACSTGLAAVHTGVQQLLSLESDIALAGACSLQVPQHSGYLYSEGGILSKTGRCRPFDSTADGTVGGSGGVMVVMKRLDDAIRDKDIIYGIIAGSATNNDGSQKAGFTAPSVGGQIAVMNEALRVANLDPSQIGYVEAHGTGTEVGDPIELTALDKVYGNSGRNGVPNPCYVGAVKAVTGHLDTASGLVGLVKCILSLKYKQIPGNHYFDKLNHRYELNGGRLNIPNQNIPWDLKGDLRRAAISSLGLGGTNVHMILEEPPVITDQEKPDFNQPLILPLSASGPDALMKIKDQMDDVCQNREADLRDISYTLREGRIEQDWRMVSIRDNPDEKMVLKPQKTDRAKIAAIKNVFLFPGQGSQYDGMGSGLYQSNTHFKKHADKLIDAADPFAPGIASPFFRNGIMPKSTAGSQLCMYLLQRALTHFLSEIGFEPDIVLGHSLGEYSAAVSAGALDETDAANIIFERGTLIDSTAEGAMLTVLADWVEIEKFTDGNCEPAAFNATGIVTVSGLPDSINTLESKLDPSGITSIRLQSNRAFHSKELRRIDEQFLNRLLLYHIDTIEKIWISTYHGSIIKQLDHEYWINQMLNPVQFQNACHHFDEKEHYRFFEIGPGSQLSGLIRRNVPFVQKSDLLNTLDSQKPEWRGLLNSMAQCWISGEYINWNILFPDPHAQKIPLPNYPFAETTYWLSEPSAAHASISRPDVGKRISELAHQDDWIQRFSYERSESIPAIPGIVTYPVCVISNDPFGDSLKGTLNAQTGGAYSDAIHVVSGFLESNSGKKNHVVCYLGPQDGVEELYEINRLIAAISSFENSQNILFTVIGTAGFEITGSERVQPTGAAVAALLRDISMNEGQISLNYIDIDDGHTPLQTAGFISQLENEMIPDRFREYIYRGAYQWARIFRDIPITSAKNNKNGSADIHADDVCLISGGTGALGLHLADWLKNRCNEIILLSRRTEENLTPAEKDKIQKLRESDTQIHVICADVTNHDILSETQKIIRNKTGKSVSHLFHLAGTVSDKDWDQQSKGEFTSGFRVKVNGLSNLFDLFDSDSLKSVTLYSSLSVYTGSFAGPAYSASCAMMENFAARTIPAEKLRIINWGGWKDGGMAVKLAEQNNWSDAQIKQLSNGAFSFEDGNKMLDKVMSLKPQTLIVSKNNLRNRVIDDFSENKDHRLTNDNEQVQYQRPDIGIRFTAPSNDVEAKLAEIWKHALGLDQVGVDDNFFDLGADSMMMIHVTERINKSFQNTISKTDLFEFTTIRKLAEHLSKNGIQQSGTSNKDLKSRADKKRAAAAQQAQRALEARKKRNNE